MKKTLKIIMASIIALAMFFSTYQIHSPLDKESKKTITISFNKQTAEAKGLFPIFKPKPKPKPKPKKKKKTTAQIYNGAKKKGVKVKGRNAIKKAKKGDSKLPTKYKSYHSMDLVDSKGVKQRRYFGKNGKADMDIDYYHAVDKKSNVKFPHRHYWRNGERSGH
ncbi:hypothetical protein CW357_18155 [Rummeliibacillus sp. TYF005]|nr:hypothetical protein CW357_18155 [Rummeliibacillus sp. TYF005]